MSNIKDRVIDELNNLCPECGEKLKPIVRAYDEANDQVEYEGNFCPECGYNK